jgi:hypothetical protein
MGRPHAFDPQELASAEYAQSRPDARVVGTELTGYVVGRATTPGSPPREHRHRVIVEPATRSAPSVRGREERVADGSTSNRPRGDMRI